MLEDKVIDFRPINEQVILVRVAGKQRVTKNSKIIVPGGSEKRMGGDFSRIQECWVVALAADCKHLDRDIKIGAKVMILDGFVGSMQDSIDEVIDFNQILVDPRFSEFKKELEDWEGYPYAFMVHPNAIAAIYSGEGFEI